MKMPCAMEVGQSCDAALTISINIIIINEVRLTSVMLEARIFSEASMDAVIIDGGYAQFTSYKPSKVYPSYRRRRRNYSTMCPYSHQIRRATRRNR